MSIKTRILELFDNYNELSVLEITKQLNVSKQSVHLCLKKLQEEEVVQKFGRVPLTFYKLLPSSVGGEDVQISLTEDEQTAVNTFTRLNAYGELITGIPAIADYYKNTDRGIHEFIKLFAAERIRINRNKDTSQLINGHNNFRQQVGVSDYNINDLYHVDYEFVGEFGKSRLGILIELAKTTQSDSVFELLIKDVKKQIVNFVYMSDFDAVAFVPPTIPREKQIMKVLEEELAIALPKINIHKVFNEVPVAQKSRLSKESRAINAENSFMVPQQAKYKHLLLIDDIMTTGITLNTIAQKIKRKKIVIKITGLTLLLDNKSVVK